MPYPGDVLTRTVSVGGAMVLESATLLRVRVTVTASRSLIRASTGYRFENLRTQATSEAGSEVQIVLPRTDIAGWKDARSGAVIDVTAPDSYSHMYTALVEFLDADGNSVGVAPYTLGPFVLPAGDGVVDLDTTVPASTVAGGSVSVPDWWGTLVEQAQQAAADAAAASANSIQNTPEGRQELAESSEVIGAIVQGAGDAVEVAKGVDIAPIYALPRGGKFVILGDSLIASNETGTTTITRSDSSSAHVAFASGGKLWYPKNAGIAGDTSAQMLARFDTDVLAYAPHICIIAPGTNDARTGVPVATYRANVSAIVAKCVAAGIFPVIRNVPPCYDVAGVGGEAAVRQRVAAYNAWIKEWAPSLGIPVVDLFSEFVDPTNGRIRAPYAFGDGIHFERAGYVKQGEMIAEVLMKYLGAALSYLATDAGDPTDLLAGAGLFLGTPAGNGLPAGWTTGDATHTTFSVADSPDGFGKELTVTALGTAAYQVQAYRFVNTGINVGDVLEVSGVMSRTVAAGHTAQVTIAIQGSPAGLSGINRQTNHGLTGGSFSERFVVPSGTSGGILLRLFAGPSAGTSKFRRLRVRNLTTLGVL